MYKHETPRLQKPWAMQFHLIAERAADRSYGEKYSEIMKDLINGGANPWQVDDANVSPISMTNEPRHLCDAAGSEEICQEKKRCLLLQKSLQYWN